MIVAVRCRFCGTSRNWEKGNDDTLRPQQAAGPYGVGHYPFRCTSQNAEQGICLPVALKTPGERMVRALAENYRKARKRTYRI